jgi:hypothetical protein
MMQDSIKWIFVMAPVHLRAAIITPLDFAVSRIGSAEYNGVFELTGLPVNLLCQPRPL